MKSILREPLLHFLLLGAAVFAAYSLGPSRGGAEPGRIVVTQGQIESMAVGYTRTWQRPPSSEEMETLIRDRVREEVYFREAIALGLDKDDTIIRRRLRQKMEFLTDDLVAQVQPTSGELAAYLAAHPDAFRVQRTFTFRHVYLNPDKRGPQLPRDATALLSQLRSAGGTADVSVLGDPFLLEHDFASVPAGEVAKMFGDEFAATLGEVSPGQWQGPLKSGYGVHLVFVDERTEGRVPPLDEIRDAVSREWANARRQEANEKLFAGMLARYQVTVEAPGVKPKAVAGLDVK